MSGYQRSEKVGRRQEEVSKGRECCVALDSEDLVSLTWKRGLLYLGSVQKATTEELDRRLTK